MTENLNQEEEEAILERYVRNQLLIKELEADNELLKGFIKERPEAYPAGTYKKRGKFYIKVTSNSRIDDGLAVKELDYRTYTNVTKKVIDPKRARQVLKPDQLEKITKVYDNRIEIGLTE